MNKDKVRDLLFNMSVPENYFKKHIDKLTCKVYTVEAVANNGMFIADMCNNSTLYDAKIKLLKLINNNIEYHDIEINTWYYPDNNRYRPRYRIIKNRFLDVLVTA